MQIIIFYFLFYHCIEHYDEDISFIVIEVRDKKAKMVENIWLMI